jgi:hypothetical protein
VNSRNLAYGVIGGLGGGVVFGAMMGMMGMLPIIGQMVGQPNVVAGFIVHLGISATIGASFAVLLGGVIRGLLGGIAQGLIYGTIWWLLGPLTLMPLFMGMGLGVNWNAAAASAMMPSLVGHFFNDTATTEIYTQLRGSETVAVEATAS